MGKANCHRGLDARRGDAKGRRFAYAPDCAVPLVMGGYPADDRLGVGSGLAGSGKSRWKAAPQPPAAFFFR